MTELPVLDGFARFSEPTTLTIQRLLPGPLERVWDYLTHSDLRKLWLASGEMELAVGAPFTLTWRNDELTEPPGQRPEGFGPEHSLASQILACEPPVKLAFAWGEGVVTMDLAARGDKVLLSVTHSRITERSGRLMIGAGWHCHLDLLATRLAGGKPALPFWDGWTRLRQDYDSRLPA